MKYLLFALFIILMTGCSEDNEEPKYYAVCGINAHDGISQFCNDHYTKDECITQANGYTFSFSEYKDCSAYKVAQIRF